MLHFIWYLYFFLAHLIDVTIKGFSFSQGIGCSECHPTFTVPYAYQLSPFHAQAQLLCGHTQGLPHSLWDAPHLFALFLGQRMRGRNGMSDLGLCAINGQWEIFFPPLMMWVISAGITCFMQKCKGSKVGRSNVFAATEMLKAHYNELVDIHPWFPVAENFTVASKDSSSGSEVMCFIMVNFPL